MWVTCGCVAVVDWVFISPHLDDVALSCGGAVAKAARSGSPLIVTVFAGKPGKDISEFAQFQHQRWQLGGDNAVDLRRDEDRQAAERLGSSVRVHWMEYPDAIYRDPNYSSDEALFGEPLECDIALAEGMHKELRGLDANRYVVPLGVGNHVDHQLVVRAGTMLLREGADVWGYAEVPYALDDKQIAAALLDINVHDPVVIWLDDDALARKCDAVRCYESQLPVLFRERGDACEELKALALHQGAGKPAELVWRLRQDDPLLRRRPFVA
ncbi:PIG-L family deacetylase [soil metagenome]